MPFHISTHFKDRIKARLRLAVLEEKISELHSKLIHASFEGLDLDQAFRINAGLAFHTDNFLFLCHSAGQHGYHHILENVNSCIEDVTKIINSF